MMKNIEYLSYITYALIISGYIVTFLFPSASIAGYSCVSVGLFIYLVLNLVPLTHVPQLSGKIFIPFIPIIIVLGISVWVLSLNIKLYNNIKNNKVTNDYNTFNTINFILLLLQLVLLAKKDIQFSKSLVAFIASFQIISVFIMQMNLEYFTTDG